MRSAAIMKPTRKFVATWPQQANADADACIALEPQAAACLYGRAVALGLNARAHPTRANEYLTSMLDALKRAESADPNYDEAGPARVRALVLIRAPGWPLGPGDAESGLAAARRAVTLRPEYPPNQLALAEALAKTGDGGGALQIYARARDAAQAFPASPTGTSGCMRPIRDCSANRASGRRPPTEHSVSRTCEIHAL